MTEDVLASKLRTLLGHRILHTLTAFAAKLLTVVAPDMNPPVQPMEPHGVRPRLATSDFYAFRTVMMLAL